MKRNVLFRTTGFGFLDLVLISKKYIDAITALSKAVGLAQKQKCFWCLGPYSLSYFECNIDLKVFAGMVSVCKCVVHECSAVCVSLVVL